MSPLNGSEVFLPFIRHSSDSQVMYAWNKPRFPLSVYFGIYIAKHIVCMGIQEASTMV